MKVPWLLTKQMRESRYGNGSFLEKVEKTPYRVGVHKIFGMADRYNEVVFFPLFPPSFENYLHRLTHFLEGHSAEIQLARIAETEEVAPASRQRRTLAGAAHFILQFQAFAA